MLCGCGTQAWIFFTHQHGAKSKRRLCHLTHGGVRGPLEEKGAVEITQIGALEVEILIFLWL